MVTTTPLKETQWLDAWVRWEKNPSTDALDDDVDDEELPPPTERFIFTYPNPAKTTTSTSDDNNNNKDTNGQTNIDKDVIELQLDGFPSDSEQTWNSTGLTLWKSSHHLCQHLVSTEAANTLQNSKRYPNLRILEVGSGLGRCGLLAHRLSHEGVTTILTDGDTDALKMLRQNVENNTIKAYGDNDDHDRGNNISCRQLLWGEEHAENFLTQQPSEGASKLSAKFDIILGSDLIYVQSVIRPLFETVRVLLSDEAESKFLMAHCARREGNEVDLPMVFDGAEAEGFGWDVLIEEDDISVFCFKRKQC